MSHSLRELVDLGSSEEAEIVAMLRKAAREVTGGNCAFVDDDLKLLTHLAQRAVNAGLIDGLHQSIQDKLRAITDEKDENDARI